MNAVTLVNLVHLNSNITHSKWAVLSPELFAGTLAGLVFIWRCAILVDSLDTLRTCEFVTAGIEHFRTAACVNDL